MHLVGHGDGQTHPRRRRAEDVVPKAAVDVAYQHAKENTRTARAAHGQALAKVMLHLPTDGHQIYKQYVEHELFKRFVGGLVYAITNSRR